ncbi:methionyl-tRNA formyltransferase [Gangjinia marincola]|uniref:Methionyl-tRNA formyltransferase n=1 Tax=Gangjinia marincola TaxID=578463 RepID=A0ABP3XSK4_9FLAO
MKIALVGNNDGPLRLYNSMKHVGLTPVFVGLQKEPSAAVLSRYEEEVEIELNTNFQEEKLLKHLTALNERPDLIMNCFCNFKFVQLLDHYIVLNVHPSPLPLYRGRHPLHWALINGEQSFGISIHEMTQDFDAGAIYWQKMIRVPKACSVQLLRERLMKELESDFGSFLKRYIHEEIIPIPNPREKATYIKRRYPADSELTEWNDGAMIYRKIHALKSEDHPAFIHLNEQKIPIFDAEMSLGKAETVSKVTITKVNPDGILVTSKDGRILTLRIKHPEDYSLEKNQVIS